MELEECYKNILLSNGITDTISNITVTESGAKGEGMASLTENITVKFATEREPLQLFVKKHPNQHHSQEVFIRESKAFEKEARFFMEFLPEARKICENHGANTLVEIYPKCYFGDDKLIVLENVVLLKDYEMLKNGCRHDLKTASLVLESLAKHHAISHAVIQQYTDKDKLFERFPNFDYDGFLRSSMNVVIEQFCDSSLQTSILIVEKILGDPGRKRKLVETLKSFEGKCGKLALKAYSWDRTNSFFVLIHGDFKNNNMMFRKNPETGETENLLIDFQMIRYNSPALDIVNYFFTSVDSKVRRSNLHELLETYRQTFNKVTEDLNCAVNLKHEDLFLDYGRKLGFPLFMGMFKIDPEMDLREANKKIDMTKMSRDEVSKLFQENLLKWIEKNPSKGKEIVDELSHLVNLYPE